MPTPLDAVVLILSLFCGVLGVSLLLHKGVRMMRGGLVHTVAVGLAVIGITLTAGSVAALMIEAPAYLPQVFQIATLVVLYYIAYSAWSYATKMLNTVDGDAGE